MLCSDVIKDIFCMEVQKLHVNIQIRIWKLEDGLRTFQFVFVSKSIANITLYKSIILLMTKLTMQSHILNFLAAECNLTNLDII